MFFEVTIAICYTAHERPHTSRHPFRTEGAAHAFITRRIREITERFPAWSVLSDIAHTSDHGVARTVALAHRNEVRATLRLETRRFEDDLEETLTAPALPPEADMTAYDDGAPQPEPNPYAESSIDGIPAPAYSPRRRHTSKHKHQDPHLHGKGHGGNARPPQHGRPRPPRRKKKPSNNNPNQ